MKKLANKALLSEGQQAAIFRLCPYFSVWDGVASCATSRSQKGKAQVLGPNIIEKLDMRGQQVFNFMHVEKGIYYSFWDESSHATLKQIIE